MNRPLDVTVVMFDDGFSSTAIGPMGVFYSAGLLWQRFHGEPELPRVNVRSASVDGRPITEGDGGTITPHWACAGGVFGRTS